MPRIYFFSLFAKPAIGVSYSFFFFYLYLDSAIRDSARGVSGHIER